MNKTIRDYFRTEMQLLNESFVYFNKAHPKAAAKLHLDSYSERDPHIERLLEGNAYLTARIKQQIDLGVHQIGEAIIRHLAPAYLTPRPSMTIIEFSSRNNRLVKCEKLPKGIKLYSRPVGDEQTECEFYTLSECLIHPLQLSNVELSECDSGKQAKLTLNFKVNDGVNHSELTIDSIPLFINAPITQAREWHYYLTRQVIRIKVNQEWHQAGFDEAGQISVRGISHHALSAVDNVDKSDVFEPLSTYFLFPESGMFLDLKLRNLSICNQSFSIEIEFAKSSPSLRANSELFKLHCIPAINLFSTTAEPIRFCSNQTDFPVVINKTRLESNYLYEIQSVCGIDRNGASRVDIDNYHHAALFDSKTAYYRLCQSYEDKGQVRNRLFFSGNLRDSMLVSCDVLACNGHYPKQYINVGDLYLRDNRVSLQIQATNLTRPSSFDYPILDGTFSEAVLSSLNASFEQITELSFLKRILHLHDWRGAAETIIESLVEIERRCFNRIRHGMVQRGIEVVLTINDDAGLSLGNANQFGDVLHQIFRQFAPVTIFLETTILLKRSRHAIHWH